MFIPNYIPDPVEVTGNASLSPYLDRVKFAKKVMAYHFLSVVGAFAASAAPWPRFDLRLIAIGVFTLIFTLSLVRIETRGTQLDQRLSLILFPALWVSLAFAVHEMRSLGWPVWSVLCGEVALVIYAATCGRDYSWFGQWFLSLVGSSLACWLLANQLGLTAATTWAALLTNAGFLTYVVYDSAMIMRRRRIDEAGGAVVDLYRDVLNVFGYAVRCWRHWKQHGIWIPR